MGLIIGRSRQAGLAEMLVLAAMFGMMALTMMLTHHGIKPQRPLGPVIVALLLVGNLLPAMALMVLLAGRIARRRSLRSPLGGRGRLHVRLVALFSVLAALPTLLLVIFASLLFQYGVRFWFSDRARVVLQSADKVVQTYVREHKDNLANNQASMVGDLLNNLVLTKPGDPRRAQYFAFQVFLRSIDQAALIQIGPDGTPRMIEMANLDNRPPESRIPRALLPLLKDGKPHTRVLSDRLQSVQLFDADSNTYLWIEQHADPAVLAQAGRANLALGSYTTLVSRARLLQLQFNAALYAVSLLIVGLAIWIALALADRLVRPIGDLVGAARRVAGGDLTVRVRANAAHDEVGALASAFNRMTRRLQEQTGALENRRALIEAVLSGVSAGVISVDRERVVTLVNLSAEQLLRTEAASALGRRLVAVAPDLDGLLDTGERGAVVQLGPEGEARTLAVTVVRAGHGHVLTFDDITQQLADQRRAAWADVARRIAHEIKNPLTPIQLAAERLQRRYGREIVDDGGTFERLVSTIVRQVGDIRRMIDEFSAFARMPKPQFDRENLVEIIRQALFLQEVAHPAIRFTLATPADTLPFICDRRQLGQAFTNILKNAVEAVEARAGEGGAGSIAVGIADAHGRRTIEVADDGVGLPSDRERLTEPYMTTRAKGTGLGLAIVSRIVEEHGGTISFADRPGGGSVVRLDFDLAAQPALAEPPPAAAAVDRPEPAFARSL
jgi:two-component system nitrogen regulation sensor histidine kinase NtrY